MPRSVLTLVIVAALGLGGLQALAAGGVMTQADVLGVSSMLNGSGGPVSETASEQGHQHKKDKAKNEQEATTEGQDQDDDDESTATAAQTEQQEEEGACAANSDTHGCAVSKAVHEALEATPPGRDRGVAVSTAARTADCSMLPQGAQDACAKRAQKNHPHASITSATNQTSAGKGGKK